MKTSWISIQGRSPICGFPGNKKSYYLPIIATRTLQNVKLWQKKLHLFCQMREMLYFCNPNRPLRYYFNN